LAQIFLTEERTFISALFFPYSDIQVCHLAATCAGPASSGPPGTEKAGRHL
jgi:hypothetical protein